MIVAISIPVCSFMNDLFHIEFFITVDGNDSLLLTKEKVIELIGTTPKQSMFHDVYTDEMVESISLVPDNSWDFVSDEVTETFAYINHPILGKASVEWKYIVPAKIN